MSITPYTQYTLAHINSNTKRMERQTKTKYTIEYENQKNNGEEEKKL